MNQTSIIAASLIVAFLVFITVRGELPGYLSVFDGTAAVPISAATTPAATSTVTPGTTVGLPGGVTITAR